MGIHVVSRHLGEVVVLVTEVFADERGFFMETFRADQFKAFGLPHEFAQENHSHSKKGVVRGLHFQWDPPMGKLVRVTLGSAFLVAADIRKGSPTLGQWVGVEVSAENKRQVWAPAGFAHGFCVLSEFAEVQYKCTALYNPAGEGGIRWNDPQLGIQWPLGRCILSEKDQNAPTLAEWLASPDSDRFRYAKRSGGTNK